ncbi:MAG: TIGR04255 family protein [Planctomycetota bacterium]
MMSAQASKQDRASDHDLPEFRDPPLAEVVLGIQFDPLVGMAAAHMDAIWELFRQTFPRTEDRQPLLATFERFDPPPEPGAVQWNLDLFARPSLPRCWFINDSGDELLQLQQDRFLHNWRKVKSQPEYPRYAHLRQSFEEEVEALRRFAAHNGIGVVKPNQCEITYINHIVAGAHWREHWQAARVFRPLADADAGPFSARPEHVRWETAFVMREDDGEPRRRLHVSVVSGFIQEGGAPMFAMTLTARGAPICDELTDIMGFLDLGHRWIVRSFADLTTEAMHAAWGRKTR